MRLRVLTLLATTVGIAAFTGAVHYVAPSDRPDWREAYSYARQTISGLWAEALPLSEKVDSILGWFLTAETAYNTDPAFVVRDLEDGIDPIQFVYAHVIPDALTEPAPGINPQRITLSVDSGDTLMSLLADADVPEAEAKNAVNALRAVYDPRRLKAGQEVAVLFGGDSNSEFMGLEFDPGLISSVSVSRVGDAAFKAVEVAKSVQKKLVAAQGTIRSSLFEAGAEAGVPISILSEMLKIYSYDVDFQRDIQRGDGFRIIFEREFTEDGTPVRDGQIVHAAMVLNGKELPRYRYTMPDGSTDMFDRKGESVRRALLRTPVDGARVTSGFGMRKHPIQGFSKMHKGVDFGAPTGTPIFAAGDGMIEDMGARGAYGNYIRVKHTSLISTAYAHMSRFAKGMNRGTRVRQGDVIGYVGTTGRSTGPHLHFEVMRGGRQVNPLSIDLPTGRTLDGKALRAFQVRVNEIDAVFANLSSEGLQLANLSLDEAILPKKRK